ncbi:conserved lipothrixviral and rudiviral protein [Sulfolobus islandicus filamentous virus 2]|uniref:Conserved lipothrixviral and rudiviral protein n=1 Tax=Sulfolobus islandicus filamentous virus 2 TaxID=1902331 RepID=A0A1D8BJ66_SIFV|nr:conserved lipothrixviral and rudiviral protein [Sulfolobus islandicus filamentous virus 2]
MTEQEEKEDEKVSFGIYIPKSLKKRLKVYCAEHDRRVNDVIKEALEEYLQRRGA